MKEGYADSTEQKHVGWYFDYRDDGPDGKRIYEVTHVSTSPHLFSLVLRYVRIRHTIKQWWRRKRTR